MRASRRLTARLVQSLFVLWSVATLLFLIFRLAPGNPLVAYIDPTFTPEQQEAILHDFGLDKPLWDQYWIYLGNLAVGDLGQSFFYKRPVLDVVLEVFPNSLALALSGLIAAYLFGIVAGAWLAWRRGTWMEGAGLVTALASRAAPEFWVGMVLLAVFAFNLGWFPAGGATSPGSHYDSLLARLISADYLHHLALPAVTLALYLQGLPLLLMRSTMLDVMQEEFVTLARMQGLPEWRIMLRHAARNALLPVATAFALGIGLSVGGDVVIETVFSWPGLGRLLVNAVASSDYPVAQGAFLLITLVLVTMNFAADVLYQLLDPRVAHVSHA